MSPIDYTMPEAPPEAFQSIGVGDTAKKRRPLFKLINPKDAYEEDGEYIVSTSDKSPVGEEEVEDCPGADHYFSTVDCVGE